MCLLKLGRVPAPDSGDNWFGRSPGRKATDPIFSD